jgi:hypothetical protein
MNMVSTAEVSYLPLEIAARSKGQSEKGVAGDELDGEGRLDNNELAT